MTPEQWIGVIAGLTGILTAFIAALRWTVHQFAKEIHGELFQRMDRIEADIGVLSTRQSDIYAKLMTKGGNRGQAKDKGTKARKPPRQRKSR